MSIFWRDRTVKFKDDDTVWVPHYGNIKGSFAGQSTVSGLLTIIQKLAGFSAGQSTVSGILTVTGRVDFYESCTNSITTFFNALAEANNFVVRYDNDLQDIPDTPWLETRVDFGKPKQFEMRGEEDNVRYLGIFNVIVRIPIGIGSSLALNIADIIAAKFRTAIIDETINFQVPRIENVGRYEDDHLITVICPFQVDNYN